MSGGEGLLAIIAAVAGAGGEAAALAGVSALAGACALAARWLVGPFARLLGRRGEAANWLGERVSVAEGAAVAASALGGLTVLAAAGHERAAALLAAGLAAAAGGCVDDLVGGTGPRGLRGHLRALLAGKPSTGLVKVVALAAAGAAVAAGAAASPVAEGSPGEVAVTVALVALAGNVANCLDLRPGRAGKVFLLAGGALAISAAAAGRPADAVLLVPFLAAVAACLPLDLGRRTMLGDTGANLLGVAFGAVLAWTAGPVGRASALVVLAALQLAAETVSLTALIGGSRWLRRLDQWGQR